MKSIKIMVVVMLGVALLWGCKKENTQPINNSGTGGVGVANTGLNVPSFMVGDWNWYNEYTQQVYNNGMYFTSHDLGEIYASEDENGVIHLSKDSYNKDYYKTKEIKSNNSIYEMELHEGNNSFMTYYREFTSMATDTLKVVTWDYSPGHPYYVPDDYDVKYLVR